MVHLVDLYLDLEGLLFLGDDFVFVGASGLLVFTSFFFFVAVFSFFVAVTFFLVCPRLPSSSMASTVATTTSLMPGIEAVSSALSRVAVSDGVELRTKPEARLLISSR